jgi:protein SCO1
MFRIRLTILSAVVLVTAFFAACHRSQPPSAKRYHFTGRVVSIDVQSQSAVIDGDNVPGFMDAMAMSYKIKPPEMVKQLVAGDSIAADLVSQEPDYWLENVKVTGHGKTPASQGSAQRTPAPGDDVPDFQLTNQNGEHISLKQYHGQALLVTFIYTRCPFPNFCPRMSRNFAEIDKQISSDPALARAHLLSISFDPDHDSPKVLRDYAFSVTHTHDAALFNRWEFAVPRAADLPKIAGFFGLIAKPDSGLITHNLSTTVIGPDGKIVAWYHGGDWQISDLMKDATEALKTSVAARR